MRGYKVGEAFKFKKYGRVVLIYFMQLAHHS
jgi:hypothetical protein